MQKNLVILRAGDASLHRVWLAQSNREFDIFVSYYGNTAGAMQDGADYYEVRKGPKWSCIAELLLERQELLDKYSAFWFPDDDLLATTETLNRMFGFFHTFGLSLAQPALTNDSYHYWPITLQDSRYLIRFTQFVEVMAPIFDRTALKACAQTFGESRSGWGLDFVWPKLCGRGRHDSIGIIDATPVKHTRPLGGELYKNNAELTPHDDAEKMLKKYGVERIRKTATKYSFGGVKSMENLVRNKLIFRLGL
ncbi:DUF707 domain-containing protein [Paraburkholderia sp. EG285A]|uniref:DUF707 domain-containing protein n=1 Tax=Paraburkholderia sp. EG285A TaxID=3237009 RepID=UPI0034D18C7D